MTTDIRVASIQDDDEGYRKVTNVIEGRLADRVRARLQEPAGEPVTLTEEHIQWGTEWTREFEATFEVAAGSKRITFIPDSTQVDDWVDGASRPETIRDTVYARFDAWLRAGDDVDALIAEWFEPHEVCNWWESWLVKPGTVLHRAVTRRAPGRVERVTLARIPAKVAENHRAHTQLGETDWAAWRLDTIAPANADGFRQILQRRHFAVGEYDQYAGTISPTALRELTDELMVGDAR